MRSGPSAVTPVTRPLPLAAVGEEHEAATKPHTMRTSTKVTLVLPLPLEPMPRSATRRFLPSRSILATGRGAPEHREGVLPGGIAERTHRVVRVTVECSATLEPATGDSDATWLPTGLA